MSSSSRRQCACGSSASNPPRNSRAQRPTSITSTLSPNERLQTFFHPWTSYLIVPLFALANAGIQLNGSFLRTAYTTPITLGVLIGYVAGKPVAMMLTSAVMTRLSNGRIRAPIGWAALLGSGTIAGIGFTVALLIADRAFSGAELAEAKLGALTAAVVSSLLTWIVYRLTAFLSPARRARALLGDVRLIQDLIPEVDAERDHIRGPLDASITVIEFGDFECPYCGQAEPVARDLLADTDLRFVWRHLPLTDVHPAAQLAAEASEAAGCPGQVLGDARPAARAPGRTHARPTWSATPPTWTSTSTASTTTSNATCTRRGSPKTSNRPTSAARPEPPRSSSTDSATTARTTSTRSRPQSRPLAPNCSSRPSSPGTTAE